MSHSHPGKLNRAERLMRLLTVVRAGEGRCILLFGAHIFLVMCAYYVTKALRESFLLNEADAEVRSYAVALNGVVLLLILPLYSALRRVVDNARLVIYVTLFFAANMLAFLVLYPLHLRGFGMVFFVWVGLYGLMVIVQFWSMAAGAFNTKTGQRLFPVIMLAATLGALAGAQLTDLLIEHLGPLPMLGIGALVLASTALLVRPELRAIPEPSASRRLPGAARITRSLAGGFRVVFGDHYLLLLALFVVLLNCIVTTGDFLLANLVRQHADAVAGTDHVAREAVIVSFYARYQFWVTLSGVIMQTFVVSRIYALIGVRGAVLVLPVIALLVYGGIPFVPIFTLIWIAKAVESGTNISLMNTTQQALYLPTSTVAKYDGKMTIDTFFLRLGDVLQAGLVWLGLHRLGLSVTGFALVNALLVVGWIAIALAIGRRYASLVRTEVANTAPVRVNPLANIAWRPGERLQHALAVDAFDDADPGDVLRFAARLQDGGPLPGWLEFDEACGIFSGTPPAHAPERITIVISAIDIDGARATAVLLMVRSE